MRDEDWIISLTAFIAFAAYIGGFVNGRNTPRSFFFSASNIWMIGFTVFVMHFISAFHYKYEWSHVKALEFTAKQTFELFSLDLWYIHLSSSKQEPYSEGETDRSARTGDSEIFKNPEIQGL